MPEINKPTAILRARSNNLGDEIQFIALKDLLQSLGVMEICDLDRDSNGVSECHADHRITAYGWIGHNPHNWPLSTNFKVNYQSIHLANTPNKYGSEATRNIILKNSRESLLSNGPVGARDLETLFFLLNNSIPAYFSGCFTLTLPRINYETMNSKYKSILLVDVPENICQIITQNDNYVVTKETNSIDFRISDIEREKLARYRINQIQRSDLVISSRLHIVLPALGMGIPCVLIDSNLEKGRFMGYSDFFQQIEVSQVTEKNIVQIIANAMVQENPLIKQIKNLLREDLSLWLNGKDVDAYDSKHEIILKSILQSVPSLTDYLNSQIDSQANLDSQTNSNEFYSTLVSQYKAENRINATRMQVLNSQNSLLKSENELLEKSSDELKMVYESRSWRYTEFFRLTLSNLLIWNHFFRNFIVLLLISFRRIKMNGIFWAFRKLLYLARNPVELRFLLRARTVINSKISLEVTSKDNRVSTVSVIVPNYNHQDYLEDRLVSIVCQSRPPDEIILLDDASTDDSYKLLNNFKNLETNLNIKIVRNSVNSGSPFRQWKRGLELASCDVIWIAESDDIAELNFLERMLESFDNGGVIACFSSTSFFENEVSKESWHIREYWSSFTNLDPNKNWVFDLKSLLGFGFKDKNLIPNVSSLIFRKPSSELLRESDFETFRYAGDWAFYLRMFGHGLIQYRADVVNHYRVHKNSSIQTALGSQKLEIEVNRVKSLANTHQFPRLSGSLHYPNVAIFVFALTSGGGEIQAIRIANGLFELGCGVAVFNANLKSEEPGIRNLLHPSIPLLDVSNWELTMEIVKGNYDVVHTHHATVDYSVANLLHDHSIKHIISLHGMYENLTDQNLRRHVELFERTKPNFTYCANKNKESLQALLPPAKFTFIENSVDPWKQKHLPTNTTSISFCIVSRALQSKNWELAIKWIIELNVNYEIHAKLYLVGDGLEKESLENKYRSYDFIIFVGFHSNPRDVVQHCDIGLMLSEYAGESFPLAILEYLSVGIPVVSNIIGSTEMILTDNFGTIGLLVDIEDIGSAESEFMEFVRLVKEDVDYLNQLKSRALIRATAFNVKAIAKKHLRWYQEILSDPS